MCPEGGQVRGVPEGEWTGGERVDRRSTWSTEDHGSVVRELDEKKGKITTMGVVSRKKKGSTGQEPDPC